MIRILVQKHKNKYIPCSENQNSFVVIRQSFIIVSSTLSTSKLASTFLSIALNSITGESFLKIDEFLNIIERYRCKLDFRRIN